MKNISEKNLKILVGIAAVVLLILNPPILIFRLIPYLVLWYVATLFLFKKEEKCRLYRWIAAGVFAQIFMSGWGVWRATGNLLGGLMALLIVFLFNVILPFYISTQYYTVLSFALGLFPTFIILLWAEEIT